MSDRDFFREVDEAVRHDRYRQLWDRYALHAMGVAVLIVAAVAGYKGWTYWQERKAQEAGSQFSEALALVGGGGDAAKANEMFARLAEQGPKGYQTLARFQLAAAAANAGEIDKAVATYDGLANDGSVDSILQGNAAIQAATLKLDTADFAEMEQRLRSLAEGNSPWRYSARELLGLSAYRLGNMVEAEKQFSALIGDQGTPSNLRERANMMVSLIVGAPQALSTTAK
jgi:hypothetical protein